MKRARVGQWEIAYEDRGAGGGAPVVTVHGFVISQRYMAPLATRLAASRRVLSPDLPGFGRSGKPSEALDMDGLAGALGAWMATLGLAPAHVVGNSMGCQVAMALAQRSPERVRSLVLIGPTVDEHARTLPRQAARLARDMLRERPSLLFAHVPDYLVAGPVRIVRTLGHVLRDRIEERAPHVHAPTLVLRGSRDALVSARFARELADRMPDARLEELPGAPHAANYSAPDVTAAAIGRFLAQLR